MGADQLIERVEASLQIKQQHLEVRAHEHSKKISFLKERKHTFVYTDYHILDPFHLDKGSISLIFILFHCFITNSILDLTLQT